MKRILLTGLVLAGLSASVFAQGWFDLDTSSMNNGITTDTQGNWYTGTAGFEVWELNSATLPAGINSAANGAAYKMLQTDGFSMEQTLTGQSVADGVFTYGDIKMKDVSPAGSTVVVALAAWTGAATSWSTAVGLPNAKAGVIAFVQPTSDYTAGPPTPTAPLFVGGASTWTTPAQDLVMTTVPEPSMFALAGLGAAALLIFRRRK